MAEPKLLCSKPTGDGGRCCRPVLFKGAPCGVEHPIYITNRSTTPGGSGEEELTAPSALASIDDLVKTADELERPVEICGRGSRRFYFDLSTAETYAGRSGQRLCHTTEGHWVIVPYSAPGEAIRALGPPMTAARAAAWLRSNSHDEAAELLELSLAQPAPTAAVPA